MQLKILTPFEVFLEQGEVLSLTVETPQGSFGLLPRRRDCVAPLSAGILTYSTAAGDAFVAVDEGVLTKTGARLLVSVRNAIGGHNLGKLRQAVEAQFLHLDEQEKEARIAMVNLESGFIQSFAEFHHR